MIGRARHSVRAVSNQTPLGDIECYEHSNPIIIDTALASYIAHFDCVALLHSCNRYHSSRPWSPRAFHSHNQIWMARWNLYRHDCCTTRSDSCWSSSLKNCRRDWLGIDGLSAYVAIFHL